MTRKPLRKATTHPPSRPAGYRESPAARSVYSWWAASVRSLPGRSALGYTAVWPSHWNRPHLYLNSLRTRTSTNIYGNLSVSLFLSICSFYCYFSSHSRVRLWYILSKIITFFPVFPFCSTVLNLNCIYSLWFVINVCNKCRIVLITNFWWVLNYF